MKTAGEGFKNEIVKKGEKGGKGGTRREADKEGIEVVEGMEGEFCKEKKRKTKVEGTNYKWRLLVKVGIRSSAVKEKKEGRGER